ncbi:DNA repair protein RAD5A-like [Vicia villosa]|uniref:DNA repair protein RAD5A-like n=1 Tax=Vicia villosa TaxID=3911 RepID=UPI00273B6AA4|nr:DNA repair protein RAD5A-like [Vicia villosa]
MLRRTKDTKDKEGRPILVLPPTDIQLIECEQSESGRDFYDALFLRSKQQCFMVCGCSNLYEMQYISCFKHQPLCLRHLD